MAVRSFENHLIAISGRLPRIARLRSEPYVCLTSPEEFLKKLKEQRPPADIFTFVQELDDLTPRYSYHCEPASYSVLSLSTYEHWWKKQIDAKTRNMIRKAEKNAVQLRVVSFDDALVERIKSIYDETPVRQGRAFWHFAKDFQTVKRDHETFLERSHFIGAFHDGDLIGFAKLVRSGNVGSLMQIISKIAQRDKAPNNALIAKAVEVCCEAQIAYLHYGVWGQGPLGTFKTNHGFVQHVVPRYFVPLNARGRLALKVNLHHRWTEAIPDVWVDRLASLRRKWNALRYGTK